MAKVFNQPLDSAKVPRFSGPVSFYRLPTATDLKELDIGLIGVPWDGDSTNRSGSRHGPREVRIMSTLVRAYHHVTRTSPYDVCNVADIGDVPINPVDLMDSMTRIEEFYVAIHESGVLPLSAGGNHLISLPILRGIAKSRPVGLIHFDAHSDVTDSYFGDFKYTHGSVFRRAIEEGLIDPKRMVQIGIRGSRYSPHGVDFLNEQGIRVIFIEEFFELGVEKVVAEIWRVVGTGPTYLTFDIDSLDPSFAPGTGTPEIGGYSTAQAQQMLRGLKGLNIIGADMVEVSPPYDVSGITALAGATMMYEILCVMADNLSLGSKDDDV